MSMYDEEIDETIDDLEDDTDIVEDIEQAYQRQGEEQIEFLTEVRSVMETQLEAYPDAWPAIEATAEGILNVIEGVGDGDGYVLIKRTEMTEGLLPCTRDVYESHLVDFPDTTPLDLSPGLLMAFEDINS